MSQFRASHAIVEAINAGPGAKRVSHAIVEAVNAGPGAKRVSWAIAEIVERGGFAKVLIYAGNTGWAQVANWRSFFENDLLWLVTVRDDGTIATDTDIAEFDLVVGYIIGAGQGDDLRTAAESAGVPYAMFSRNVSTGTGQTNAATDAELTGTWETNAPVTGTDSINIVNATHPITQSFGTGLLTVGNATMTSGAVEVGESTVGDVLAHANDAASVYATNQPILIAIELGTDDLTSPTPVATTERALVIGAPDNDSTSGLTADGVDLMQRAFRWLLSAKPVTPSINALTADATTVSLVSSLFEHVDEDRVHSSSRWQVTLQTDTTWASIVYDSGYTSDLTAHTAIGLDASTAYMARVLHRDDLGQDSNWSASVNFTTTDYGGGTSAVAGIEVEFYTSGDASISTVRLTTESTTYTELVEEGVTIPANTAYWIVRPIKLGGASGGAAVKEVYVDRGTMSRRFEPYPLRPEVYDNSVVVSSQATSPNSGTDPDIDWSLARNQTKTLTDSPTLTFSNMQIGTYTIRLIQDGTGSRTVTWPGAVQWAAGSAPTLTTAANAEDVIRLTNIDGTDIIGDVLALNIS